MAYSLHQEAGSASIGLGERGVPAFIWVGSRTSRRGSTHAMPPGVYPPGGGGLRLGPFAPALAAHRAAALNLDGGTVPSSSPRPVRMPDGPNEAPESLDGSQS